jgi:hypothetical protein
LVQLQLVLGQKQNNTKFCWERLKD